MSQTDSDTDSDESSNTEGRLRLEVDEADWDMDVEWELTGSEYGVKDLLAEIDDLVQDKLDAGRVDEVTGPFKTWKPTPRTESSGARIEVAGHDIALGDELHRTTTDEKMVVLQFEEHSGIIYWSTVYGYGFYAEEFLAEDFDGVGYDGEPQIELVKHSDES